ncbi:MAG TPA: hypothetical protein VED17_02380, partial [Nitrososphaerales archaeon]|nr:hypothetical protein [Nitrososphaerales archaeon]
DMLGPNLRKVLTWGSNVYKLEEALRQESKDSYELDSLLLRGLSKSGMGNELYPVSATTREGILDLSAVITRQLNQGEESEE